MNVLSKRLMLILLLWLVVVKIGAQAADESDLIGEGNDGNRSTPVHRFELLDEKGVRIRANDKKPQPFSIEKTCGKCHDYQKIAKGWHFNGHNPDVESGRSGQPWVLTDSKSRTQIPITARKWEGAYSPEQLGITPWEFLKMNYSHFPGGSYGQMDAQNPDEAIRQEISGKYEINCLACHHNSPQEDQSLAALQSARQNYRWIPTASSGKAVIEGVAMSLDDYFDPAVDEGIKVTYNQGVLDKDDTAFFDLALPANERCYFCHSNRDLRVDENSQWSQDQDVHLQSGLNCTDCHRNGDDHRMTRGMETEGVGKSLTCEGCHMGNAAELCESNRLGAPKPQHPGIPAIHFEKLTCTACHSGTEPRDTAGRWKTSRMHKTGLHGKHNLDIAQPHLYAPVLMKGTDGKIGPYKMFWPAFWAIRDGEKITPMAPADVLKKAAKVLGADVEKEDDWRPLTQEQIHDVLLTWKEDNAAAVYIAGGKLYQLDADGKISSTVHKAAQPYAWPMAHDVRPANQSLGVRNCKDCHTVDSPFFFGKVQVDTPVKTAGGADYLEMVQLQGIDRLYMWIFNFTFVFRPFLKIIALASCALIGIVVLAYVLKAAAVISNACAEEDE
jgi:hypothetical protein